MKRRFTPQGPNQLWVSDITEHPTGGGKVYVAVVLDAWSRRVVGWSIADHIRAESSGVVTGMSGGRCGRDEHLA